MRHITSYFFLMSSHIHILGLNPAWQRLFFVNRLQPGQVYRLDAARECASGKGINFARVFSLLGGQPSCWQFAGGSTGKKLQYELDSISMEHHTIPITGATRICTTLSDSDGNSTELIEPGPILSPEECEAFFQGLSRAWPGMKRIALCGTAPQGFDWPHLNALMIGNRKIYLDAWTGVQGWLEQGVELLKINAQELVQLLEESHVGKEKFSQTLVQKALTRWPIRVLVITQGSQYAFACTQGKTWSLQPPHLDQFVNAIGAGDAFLAGWIHAENLNQPLPSRLAWGVAVSATRCEAQWPWELNVRKAETLAQELRPLVQEISWNS
ncbi:MAG TPA: PfkB family carbohydrate kinase [Fibrobacteraceae bacterium]|nr:PfkB family carbohydrate kinase [Fibrobacteraceae bacterium]